jgi:hypothetical protein
MLLMTNMNGHSAKVLETFTYIVYRVPVNALNENICTMSNY